MSPHPPISDQIVFLYTNDLVATANFYENTLKLKLWRDQGTCRIYSVIESGGYLGFCEKTSVLAPTDGSDSAQIIFTIVTPEVDEWYDYLKKQGVSFEKKPVVNPKFNIYHCFFRDPNGYLIEIQRFL